MNGIGSFSPISASSARALLLLGNDEAHDVYSMLLDDIYFILRGAHGSVTESSRLSTGPGDTTESDWQKDIMEKVILSTFLPPKVKKALLEGPRDKVTRISLWTQARRCYWHALDTLVQTQTKLLFRKSSRAIKAYELCLNENRHWV